MTNTTGFGRRGGGLGQRGTGMIRRHWNNQKYGASKLGFSHARNKNCLEFGHTPSKSCPSPVLGQKSLSNIGFKGHQIIELSRVPKCLASALVTYKQWQASRSCLKYTASLKIVITVNCYINFTSAHIGTDRKTMQTDT
jgi:hypothetical protein